MTTVAEHNPYPEDLELPIRVARTAWAHSLDFSPDLVDCFRRAGPRQPFAVHAAEGTDDLAADEIRRLDKLGVLGRHTVLVHCVGADADGWDRVERSGAQVVWCPSSNLFTLGRTLPQPERAAALASDSPLTAEGDLLDEITVARRRSTLRPKRLYEMVVSGPRRLLGLTPDADFLVFRNRGLSPADALLDQPRDDLLMVVVDGEVALLGGCYESSRPIGPLQTIRYDGRLYRVDAPVAELFAHTQAVLGEGFRLAHKEVALC